MANISETLNPLANAFNRAIMNATNTESKEELMTHLKSISILFTEACIVAQCSAAESKEAKYDVDQMTEAAADKKSRISDQVYNDLVSKVKKLIDEKIVEKKVGESSSEELPVRKVAAIIDKDLSELEQLQEFKASYLVAKQRGKRLVDRINELSKKVVLQKMGARFFAREAAALRQMMDLVRNANSVEWAAKSKVWDEIDAQNNKLAATAMLLMNRINSTDRKDAPFEKGSKMHGSPKIVVLTRSHLYQGLGLEIKGGSETHRSVIISAIMEGSMADNDELHVGDRILAVDGTFVSNTTTHAEVMEMLKNECTKDFLALVVSPIDFGCDEGAENLEIFREELEDDTTQKSSSV